METTTIPMPEVAGRLAVTHTAARGARIDFRMWGADLADIELTDEQRLALIEALTIPPA
jgi:hypothetical protein